MPWVVSTRLSLYTLKWGGCLVEKYSPDYLSYVTRYLYSIVAKNLCRHILIHRKNQSVFLCVWNSRSFCSLVLHFRSSIVQQFITCLSLFIALSAKLEHITNLYFDLYDAILWLFSVLLQSRENWLKHRIQLTRNIELQLVRKSIQMFNIDSWFFCL